MVNSERLPSRICAFIWKYLCSGNSSIMQFALNSSYSSNIMHENNNNNNLIFTAASGHVAGKN